jgi:hypothetical protein
MNKYTLFLLLFFLCGCATKKNYLVYNESNINITQMKNTRFDIETFNKNNKSGTYEYIHDNLIITQEDWENQYVEYIKPVGKFYNILNTYYLNGNLKKHGIRLNEGFKIKTWEYYDEQGNLIKEIDEDADFKDIPYDYNKVFLWLDKNGYINIKKGEVITDYSLNFNTKTKRWTVDVKEKTGEWNSYVFDGKTGKILSVSKINVIY